MFYDAKSFNQDLSAWDVSSVTDMRLMFSHATSFNQDLSSWDVSSVTTMGFLFDVATSFNQDLSAWDVSSVTNMGFLFDGATSFNQNLSTWDVSSVTYMVRMFRGATSFNQDLSAWDVSSVTSMGRMFSHATSFNQDLSSWDVSSVISMGFLFDVATSFNQDLSTWDVSSVTYMSQMFQGATSFDQDLSAWDVSRVTDMSQMFQGATSFDQDLCGPTWVISPADKTDMFVGSSGSIASTVCTVTTTTATTSTTTTTTTTTKTTTTTATTNTTTMTANTSTSTTATTTIVPVVDGNEDVFNIVIVPAIVAVVVSVVIAVIVSIALVVRHKNKQSASTTQTNNKFVGGFDVRDGDVKRKLIPPIHGLRVTPEVNLATALKQLKIICDETGVSYPPEFDSLDGNIYTAKQFVDMSWNELGPKYGPSGLTKDRAMFINFYTHESPFYRKLNKHLRDENRSSLAPYFPFIKGFLSALYCLPLRPGNVKRGVKLDLSKQFTEDYEGPWWSFNSTTKKIGVLNSKVFLGTKGKRTMFDITARSLVSIKEFSSLPEEELILLPGTILKVMSVYDAGSGLTIIQMEEKEPFVPMLDFPHPKLKLTVEVF